MEKLNINQSDSSYFIGRKLDEIIDKINELERQNRLLNIKLLTLETNLNIFKGDGEADKRGDESC